MYRIGIDIGGTNIRIALLSADAEVLCEDRRRIRENTSPEQVVQSISELIQACCQTAGCPTDAVLSIGIGFAGQLSKDHQTVINAPNLGWRDTPFAALLARRLAPDLRVGTLPIHICNDLSAIGWGEYRCGAAQGFDELLVVYVGTGLGSCLITRGQLHEGYGGKAGELGHSKVIPRGGRACGCGELGCLEAYIGGRYLEMRVVADLNAGVAEDLRDFLQIPRSILQLDGRIIPSDIDQAARAAIPYAHHLWNEAAEFFAMVMSAALAQSNPQGWLLGGGVLDHCPELRQRFIQHTAGRTAKAIWNDLDVLTPRLGDRAGLIGAALLADSH